MLEKLKNADGSEYDNPYLAYFKFTVVNDPVPAISIQDIPELQIDIAYQPEEQDPDADITQPYNIQYNVIPTPFGYSAHYNYLPDGAYPRLTLFTNPQKTIVNITDANDVAPHLYNVIQNQKQLAYLKIFSLQLRGSVEITYIDDDFTDKTWVITDQLPIDYRHALHKPVSLPVHTDTTKYRRIQSNNVINFVLVPYRYDKACDLSYTDDLCQYAVYDIKAGESVNTKIFSNSSESYIHTMKGNVQIGEYEVPYQHFYKYSASQSIEVTAIEDSYIVIIARVPEIVL